MAVSALRWFKAALVLQVLLLAYWLAMEVLDLFPWNDLQSRPETFDLRHAIAVNALQQLAYMGLFALGIRLIGLISAIGYGAYLALQLWTWWPPYLFGADEAWQARYAESFARTLKVLPSPGNHLAPDAQHLVLQLLTLAVLVATAGSVAKMRHL
jgi:hypothetical protein